MTQINFIGYMIDPNKIGTKHVSIFNRRQWLGLALPRLVYILGALLIVLFAVLGFVFQINRQLTDQRYIVLNRNAHDAVRTASQLMREHLRLQAVLQEQSPELDIDEFLLRQDLVWSRLHILDVTLQTVAPTYEVTQYYDRYAAAWTAFQPQLQLWRQNSQDEVMRQQVLAAMTLMEHDIGHLTAELQLYFEQGMQQWAEQSILLNRLLIQSSAGFVVVIFIMAGMILRYAQKQAANERSLRASEQRLRAVLDTLPDAVYRVRQNGICTHYKPAKTSDAVDPFPMLVGHSIADVLPFDIAQRWLSDIAEVLIDGRERVLRYQLAGPTNDEMRSYEARLLHSSEDEVQVIVRDITDVKRQEEMALQAQKMESLGMLAGGIAHDFNNLLTGMMGQISLALHKLDLGLPAVEHVKKASVSARHAAGLIRQLLAYAGRGKLHVAPLDMNQLIREITGLMEIALPKQVQLRLDLDEQLPTIPAGHSQIQQVIMNLFMNAVDAVTDERATDERATDARPSHTTAAGEKLAETGASSQSGEITITTGQRVLKESVSLVDSANGILAPGTYIVTTVSDTGIGMDAATVSRIFDPFFSTKKQGHGLGLSAIVGIIRRHQGGLDVESQLGQGTTFTVWLPTTPKVQPETEVVESNHTKEVALSPPLFEGSSN